MKKYVLRILTFVLFVSLFMNHASCLTVKDNEWMGFSMMFETEDKLEAGNKITAQLTLTNNTDDNITITQMNHWYFQEFDNSETYPGVELGQLVDNDTNKVVAAGNSTTSITYHAKSTKTFTYTATIPDTWNSKSEITFVLAGTGENGNYWAQLDVNEDNEYSQVKEEITRGENTPDLYLNNSMADAVLTEEEMNDPYTYKIILDSYLVDVENIDDYTTELVKNNLDSNKIAFVLDLNIIKAKYDENNSWLEENPVTTLSKPISLTIDIPDEYKAENRVFSVMRVHDGVVEELPDLDNDPNTVTINTDKFSYYYLVYHQKADIKVETDSVTQNQNKPSSHDKKEKSPQTGDQTMSELYFIIMMMALVIGSFGYKKIKE